MAWSIPSSASVCRTRERGVTGDPLYLAGQWRAGAVDEALRAPWDDALLATQSLAGEAEIDAALAAATAARGACGALPLVERAQALRHVARRLGEDRASLALQLCRAVGKPIVEAEGEVDRAIRTFSLAADACSQSVSETLELAGNGRPRLGVVRRFPVGVVVAIAPFNFPLNLVAHKLAPAIAAGCPVIVKPPPQAPGLALALARYVAETSWPAGGLSVLPCAPAVAERLVTDPRAQLVSFTGSQAVGWRLRTIAGTKRVVLELGGNAAAFVDDSADLDRAAAALAASAFAYAGQKCISLQRLFLAASIYERFVAKLIAATQAIRVGDPEQRATICGPLIDDRAAHRLSDWIDEAVAAGATPLVAGDREGRRFQPAIFEGVPAAVRLAREEAFGPTLNVAPVASCDEAFAAINDSAYGLQAAIWSARREVIEAAHRTLEVGAIVVDDAPSFRDDAMPYGGVKASGLGREGVRYAIADLTEPRLLVLPPSASAT